eukprot:Gb_08027 [translate_table: standard]
MKILSLDHSRTTSSKVQMAWQVAQSNWVWRKKPSRTTGTVPTRQPREKLNENQCGTHAYGVCGYIDTLCMEGRVKEALEILHFMDKEGIRADSGSYAHLVQACTSRKFVAEGKRVHAHMIQTGFETGNFVKTKLLIMYVKCCSLVEAHHVFDELPEPNLVSWNAMITGYAQNGRIEDARQVFENMPEQNVVSWNAMIAGYTQNGILEYARRLFDEMPERNVVSWNAMIAGYAKNKQGGEALKMFSRMQSVGLKANQSTFSSILSVCSSLADMDWGRLVHARLVKTVSEPDVFVGSVLIDMYSKCGNIDDAFQVFEEMPVRNVVSWTTMVVAYFQHGRTENAHHLFEKMPEHNMVSWTAMITGYAQNELHEEALKLFSQMQSAGMKLNRSTFSSVLRTCASLAAVEQGKQVHGLTIKTLFESDVFVGSALVDMYSKCGSIKYARHLFDTMPERNVVSWTTMIAGYAQHGLGNEAVQLFEKMQRESTTPNHITFVALLSACSHAGLADEGWHYFNSMNRDHCITPRAEHYACMVDLLGRLGCVDEAEYFIAKMPFKPDAVVWGALLGACRIHINTVVGERAAEHLFSLEPDEPGTYVLLANIYAAAGLWADVARVRRMMKDKKLKKKTGCSWIVVKNLVHVFHIGDRSHPQTKKIYATLERLGNQMQEAGYVSELQC